MMKINDQEKKTQVKNRLSRIIGQLHGIQQMIDEERSCNEILQQLKAVSSSLQAANQAFIDSAVESCLASGADETQFRSQVKELISLVSR